jgi:glucose/arabinose dehydrogenase
MPLTVAPRRRDGSPLGLLLAVAAAGLATTLLTAVPTVARALPQGEPGAAPPALPMPNPTATYYGKLLAPAGFTVKEYAKVPGARFMALAPDGSVYVSQPGMGYVTRLSGMTADGRAAKVEKVLENLSLPHGLAFHGGYLYVANTEEVVRVQVDANGGITGKPLPTAASYDAAGGHFTRTVVFGPDNAMYVSIGSTCNVCVERDSTRATVMRFDADGQHGEVFARGLRNAVGLAFHPTSGALWVTQHERDNLAPAHEDTPPDELNILTRGGDYGWPYCWGQRVPSPEFNDRARCAKTIPPALSFQAHSAPLGIAFLNRATMFPADYQSDALVAFHGSWNRRAPTGDKVVRVKIVNGRPVAYEDFITGWQNEKGQRSGRPVDVLVLPDGSVLVSDDDAGLIYRVTR